MFANDYQLAVDLRHALHAHPELSHQEVWTKATLIAFIQAHTSLRIEDRDTYFYAVYEGAVDAPAIAFRADYDGLPIEDAIDAPYRSQIPGVGHKCGHDGHAASLCGLALTLERVQPDRTVVLIFQPAEEVGEGAQQCLGIFDEVAISEIYAVHNYPTEPYGVVSLKRNTLCLTSVGLNLYFHGRPSHASQPEFGLNPAFAIGRMIQFIENLTQSADRFRGFIRCTIVHVEVGEAAFGISPAEGVLRLTMRAAYREDLDQLLQVIMTQSEAECQAAGLTLNYDTQEFFPLTENHDPAVDKIWQVCQQIGQPIKELAEPFRASEDFGYFLERVPGAMFFVGDGENYPKLHTEAFDFPDPLIAIIVDVWMGLIQAPPLPMEA